MFQVAAERFKLSSNDKLLIEVKAFKIELLHRVQSIHFVVRSAGFSFSLQGSIMFWGPLRH